MKLFFLSLLLASGASLAAAEIPLNERVMVVYNANSDESQRVAKYYMAKRDIPKTNLCKIDTIKDSIDDGSIFEPEIKKPLRSCLDKLGKQKILYIVFSFETPYVIRHQGHTVAVDQLVSDIWDEFTAPATVGREAGDQPYFGKAEAQGNVYESFVPFATYRDSPKAKTIYSVWRLDGPTAEIAKSLVDKALLAEKDGLKGKSYFDLTVPIHQNVVDSGYGAGNWSIYQASVFAKRAGFDVTLDEKETEFGTSPSQLRCENAALYAGWYSLAHYNDVFSWAPGAIGFHLDSASATNPRNMSNWAGGALQRGITVTSGSVTEPFLEGLVHPDRIFLYLFNGANVGDAVLRGTRWIKWMIINLGDPLYRPFPNRIGPYAGPHQEAWFGISPVNLVGEGTVTAQFALAEKRTSTTPVTFKSNYPALVNLPTNVTLPPEANGGKFEIAVKPPEEAVNVLITITAGNETLSNTLNVFPILTNLTLSQPSMQSNGLVTGTVSIAFPAKQLGFTIYLKSSSPAAIVPDEIKIPAGATTATFPITAKPVAAETTATITAKFDSAAKTAQLKITP